MAAIGLTPAAILDPEQSFPRGPVAEMSPESCTAHPCFFRWSETKLIALAAKQRHTGCSGIARTG
jgi:hypothetical protein